MDQRHLRDIFGCFATGVTVVTARQGDGTLVGLTVNSFSSLSLSPPLVVFNLADDANCVSAFAPGRSFTVSVLRHDQQAVSKHFAAGGTDKFAAREVFTLVDGGNNCPGLGHALARLECVCDGVHQGGDHRIIIGRVEHAEHDPSGAPLLYFRSRYTGIVGDW